MTDALIFIDANLYLNFYEVPTGKSLLAALIEQQDYIFITEQVVNEVNGNKLRVAAKFLKGMVEQE